ncbi:MAG: YdeI/OmpD-associated family protein [Burkholderiaceae bacterium]
MTAPRFFKTPQDFRDWLIAHTSSADQLLVGFYKVDSGQASMTWPESVDVALCYGWIDGVRKRIDDASYTIRFTPRKTTSIWSAININKFNDLQQQGRMTPAGVKAFAHRKEAKSRIYSHEQTFTAELSADELQAFQREPAAWAYFEATPPGYKKVRLHLITTPKRAETRATRFAKLLAACKRGERIR